MHDMKTYTRSIDRPTVLLSHSHGTVQRGVDRARFWTIYSRESNTVLGIGGYVGTTASVVVLDYINYKGRLSSTQNRTPKPREGV